MATSVMENGTTNIVILGATGASGLQLIEQALARGFKVTAPVRNPKKLEHIENENLQVIQCDLMNPLELTKHLEGCTAVLSALGYPGVPISAISFYADSMKSIVTAMRNAKIKRLICMTSMYTKCK
jgi:biliverdin reductase/flavin reductase